MNKLLKITLTVSIAVTLSLLTTLPGFAQSKKAERFVENYLNVGFWKTQNKTYHLMRWAEDTITYRIMGDMKYLNDKAWSKFLSNLEDVTGRKFLRTDDDDYQILMFFGDIKVYAQVTGTEIPFGLLKNFNGWNSRNWDRKNGNLTKASACVELVKIKTYSQGIYRTKKAFIRTLGMLGESPDKNSFFHKYFLESNGKPTRADWRLIKLHYNQSLQSGLKKHEVKKILLELENIEELTNEKI